MPTSKLSANFVTLQEGFEQFTSDLNKLEQFADVNATAFSKILKKWDKTSKSRTKELYLSRAIEVQPCFNRDVISHLSDQATTSLLELGAWAEGENIQFEASKSGHSNLSQTLGTEESDLDAQLLQAAIAGNLPMLTELISRLRTFPDGKARFTRSFLAAISDAPIASLQALLGTNLVDLQAEDEINERNCLHEAAISGREIVLDIALKHNVDPARVDVYGRIPLHYASIHGRVPMVKILLERAPATINDIDHDNFTPLIHGIVHHRIECVRELLDHGSRTVPEKESDHIPLNLACQFGTTEIIELLLERKATVIADAEGLYPQHLVARTGNVPENLLTLQKYGADLNLKDKLYQWTPLFHAVSEGHQDCVRILLQQGVEVDIVDEKDLTPMYYAVWEGHLNCMQQLLAFESQSKAERRMSRELPVLDAEPMKLDKDDIPDLSLPPPIIPLRRYGHNFLDKKAFVQLTFDKLGTEAIKFYNDSKYPAARLTISSKSSDLIPRNVMLPIQEDSKYISFQVDSLDVFTIDFDVFPTFGSKIIARAVALPCIFQAKSNSSGSCSLPLFDPRLRLVGHIDFKYSVIQPFQGIPLEVNQFETYWKATSHLDIHPSSVITGSSLSGEYLQLFVQLSLDCVPVLFSQWTYDHHGIKIGIGRTSMRILQTKFPQERVLQQLAAGGLSIEDMVSVLATSGVPLKTILNSLAPNINVNLHILYPNEADEQRLGLGPSLNINDFVDAILTDVFEYSRIAREQNQGRSAGRSIIFTSYNSDICTALNWKQPNYPVLLCNSIGKYSMSSASRTQEPAAVDGEYSLSIKEAVRIAQSNNFMGLVCTEQILDMAPSLISAIKVAGLVIVADTASRASKSSHNGYSTSGSLQAMEGVNGVLESRGILKFYDTIDM